MAGHLHKYKANRSSRRRCLTFWKIFGDNFWGTTRSDHIKRIPSPSCFCSKSSRSVQKRSNRSPKKFRVHFILFSGCLMQVDRTVHCRSVGKWNWALFACCAVQLSSGEHNGAVVFPAPPMTSPERPGCSWTDWLWWCFQGTSESNSHHLAKCGSRPLLT